ncbi:MAG TPA: hypothetical protein VGM88_33755 [Kofleriaceae bacterium]|jgi:hypothetical protein
MRRVMSVVLACGCGSNAATPDSHVTDSNADSAADASIDAALDTALDADTRASVSMIATWGRVPLPGVTFYVQDTPTGPVTTVVGDSTGAAAAPIAPGGFVSAVLPAPENIASPWVVESRGGVQPGERLVFEPMTDDFSAQRMTIAFQVQDFAPLTEYDIETSCGNDQAPGLETSDPPGSVETLRIDLDGCGDSLDLAIFALPVNGEEAYLYVPNVPATEGSTFDTSGMPWKTPPVVTGHVTNAPPDAITYFSTFEAMPLGSVIDLGNRFPTNYAPIPAGTVPAALFTVSDANQLQMAYVWPAVGNDITFDESTFDLATFATAPHWSDVDHALVWTPGPGATPNVASAIVYVVGSTKNWSHSVIEPWTGGQVVFPTLPDFNIEPSNTVTIQETDEALTPYPFSWTTMQKSFYQLWTMPPGQTLWLTHSP